MKVLDHLFYTESHEWVELLEDGTALFGCVCAGFGCDP
jgi:glycine cleavage system H lipoate-binding protein